MSRINPAELNLNDRVVHINRVAKVVKGGRRFSFSALIVVGDGNGYVGYGLGKANEVPEAIRKGVEQAKKNLIKVPVNSNQTIPFEIEGKFELTLLMKPASWYRCYCWWCCTCNFWHGINIFSKMLSSNNPHNVIKATFQGLQRLKTRKIAARRGITE